MEDDVFVDIERVIRLFSPALGFRRDVALVTVLVIERTKDKRMNAYRALDDDPEGDPLASVGRLYYPQVCDRQTGAQLALINRFANALAFSPEGEWIATASATVVEIWHVDDVLAVRRASFAD